MSVRIIAIGKKHEDWVSSGIERYEKRLNQPFSSEWLLLPHSSRQGDNARGEESERILQRVKPNDFIVLLDERGKLYDSPAISRVILSPLERSQSVIFIIGGSYGVSSALFTRADCVWSLSPLVFPHQLVRLLLIEQLYRAQEIAAGRPYHHV